MSRFSRFLALPAFSLALAACSTPHFPIGTLQDDVFRHVTYDYGVTLARGSGQLMGDDWRLDNYVATPNGLGEPKRTSAYMSRISLDHDGDDVRDMNLSIPTYDLLFKHRRNDGLIFVSTFPISQHDSERDLSVMLRDYVESASHAGRITHNYQQRTSRTSAQMASRILTSREVSVDGFPAHEVIFEVANVQQLELTPSARWERGHVVLVRTELVFNDMQFRERAPVTGTTRPPREGHFYPVLMVIGYSNHPDEYDAGHPDFRSLLHRIRIGGTLDNRTLRGHAERCGVEQLDLVVSGDRVTHSSLVPASEDWSCLGGHRGPRAFFAAPPGCARSACVARGCGSLVESPRRAIRPSSTTCPAPWPCPPRAVRTP
jgi:hypothetical protein